MAGTRSKKLVVPPDEEPEQILSSDHNESGDINQLLDIDITDVENLVIPPLPAPIMNFDGTGPRLLITRIVNENFKSYAGRHTIGPFHKNFTSIVGPNGSGKSNVIDSLLFVFGYRAQKIRSKKISVLIHHSEHHTNFDHCTVEIHFVKAIDNGEHDYEVVEGSEFYVSRTAYKNSTSEYRLNGDKKHFKEIGAFLRKSGIDLDHNRFLILQGEVEQIALMKPKALQQGDEGMLEYLEDIVGSSRLVPFIESLNKRCEELNEIRSDKAKRMKVVEHEKFALEESKNEAVEYLLLENDLTKKKNLLFHFHMTSADEHCKQTGAQLDKIKTEFADHEAKLKEVKSEIDSKKMEYKEAKGSSEECSKAAEEFQATFKLMEKEDAKAQEDKKHCKAKQKKLKASIEAEKKKLEELKSQPEKAKALVEELNGKIERLEQEKPKLEKQIDEGTGKLRQATSDLQAKKESAEKELAGKQKNVNEARSKLDIAKSEFELCVGGQKRENDKLQELKSRLEALVEGKAGKVELLDKSRKELQQVERDLGETQRELKGVCAEEAEVSAKLRNDRAKMDEARSALHTNQGKSAVLQALLEEKRKGAIKGIIGRLGDLGAIDEKYDVAISTACGPLDNIVVDSIDTAQICVNFLKKRNVGQATFIGLDKMARFSDSMHRIKTPENVARLFDLIRVNDQSILPAFYFALRDTLVCDTLEQATRIALPKDSSTRWRVVTLQGHLIESYGTMSGGGSRQMKGRMGRSVAAASPSVEMGPEKIRQLDAQIQQLTESLNSLRQKRGDLEKKVENLLAASQRLKNLAEKCSLDLKSSNEEEPLLKKQVANQEKIVKQTTVDENEKRCLQKSIDSLDKEYQKINESAETVRVKVDGFHKQIMEISEKLVGKVQKRLDECNKELEECRKNITKANVSVKTAERNYHKTEEQISKFETEVQENEQNIKKLSDKMNELQVEATEILKRFEGAKEKSLNAENICVRIKADLDSIEEREQQLQAYAIDKRKDIENVENTMKEHRAKVSYWKKEIDKLKLNDLRDLKPIAAADAAVKRESSESDDDGDATATPRRRRVAADDDDAAAAGEISDDDDVTITATPAKRLSAAAAVDPRYDEFELRAPDATTLSRLKERELVHKLTVDEERLKALKPNLGAIVEFRKKLEKYKTAVQELDDITSLRDRVRAKHEELRKLRLSEFLTGFRAIATHLKEMYQMITLGGDADLDLVDTMDPFSEGIVFSVRPPKKSWKQISNLSGGEKTLSSLALVFALHHYKPTPLYVMDEIDAALDFRNVSIVANYIKDRTKNAQFIIISLRNNMFELSDRLVGIYKTHNCTKSVTVDPHKLSVKNPMMTVRSTDKEQLSQEHELNQVAMDPKAGSSTETTPMKRLCLSELSN